MKWKQIFVIISIVPVSIACTQQKAQTDEKIKGENVAEIEYRSDHCAYTGQEITTVRYGGVIELKNGKKLKFMSVECVAGYYLGMNDKKEIQKMGIVDFAEGKKLLPVDELVYLNSPLRPSPNGMNLTAVDASNEKMKTYIYDAYPGDFLSWDEVLEKVGSEWNITTEEKTDLSEVKER